MGRGIEPRESREPARAPEEAPESRESRESPERPESEAQNQSSDGILLRWSEVEAERTSDGAIRVVLTAETSSAGWRVYADHVVDRETLEIWLRGNRPRGMSAQVISYPKITLKVADAEGAIRRVLVHGTNDVNVTFSCTMKLVHALSEAMKGYEAKFGRAWKPADLLVKLAEQGKSFTR